MKIYLKVTPDYGLIPINPEGVKYIYNRKIGQELSCEIKIVRNYENLQRFFVLINTTFDMQDHFEEKEAYRYWLVMKAGYFDTIIAPNGNTIYKAKSIAFEKMDEKEFREVFSAVIDVFLKQFGNGQTEDDILQIIGFV